MSALSQEKCIPCSGGAQPANESEIAEFHKTTPEWNLIDRDGIPMLERSFKFKNWKTAQAFAEKIGAIAEEQQHHPALLIEWGKVTITWWTHATNGLHKNDFICAAKCDEAFAA